MSHAHVAPTDEDISSVAELFSALADPTRVRLLLRLMEDEASVGQLVADLGLPQSTVSRHLGVLRSRRLVTPDRRGARVHYRVSGHHTADLLHQAVGHAQHSRLHLPEHGR